LVSSARHRPTSADAAYLAQGNLGHLARFGIELRSDLPHPQDRVTCANFTRTKPIRVEPRATLRLVPCQPDIDKFLGLLSNPVGFHQGFGMESDHEQEVHRAVVG
jgi:hypothetical protein